MRYGHENVAGKATVDRHAKKAVTRAKVLVAVEAVAALTAADPREHGHLLADQGFVRIRADFIDDAGDLVTEREGQGHAAGGVELLAIAKISIAVLNVQVRMAQAAALDPHQNFPALRLRGLHDGFAERSIELHERLAAHLSH